MLPDYVKELQDFGPSIWQVIDSDYFADDCEEKQVFGNWEVVVHNEVIDQMKGYNEVRHVLRHKDSETYWSVEGTSSHWEDEIDWDSIKQVERKEKKVYIYE